MKDGREETEGFRRLGALASWNDLLRPRPLQTNSIREDETALCLDCQVTFSIRNRPCPKCDGEHFWLITNWKRPARPRAAPPMRAVLACV